MLLWQRSFFGYVVKWCKELFIYNSMQQMMPLVITPFLATGAVAIIMGVVLHCHWQQLMMVWYLG
ncbi:MAG: hypothetical protein ACLRHW_09530 [Coprobacillus cateniformis]